MAITVRIIHGSAPPIWWHIRGKFGVPYGRLRTFDFVDFSMNTRLTTEKIRNLGYLNKGLDTYVISPISDRTKYSTGYLMCTGAAIVGTCKATGHNLSLLSHQFPDYFLQNEADVDLDWQSDFTSRMHELKDRCAVGTIDCMLFGGMTLPTSQYTRSIETLESLVSSTLRCEVMVATGPALMEYGYFNHTHAMFCARNRTLTIIRQKQRFDWLDSSYPAKHIRELQHELHKRHKILC